MKMTNEIEQLEYAILLIKQDGKDYLDERDIPILETAIDIMRKYEKIVNIVSLNGEEFKQCGLKELKEILEVIADGKN